MVFYKQKVKERKLIFYDWVFIIIIHEQFSQFNSSLNKLDPLSLCELNLIGETHVRSLTNNRENAPVETGIDSINDVGEIKNRIEELKGLIKANNIQIENENKKNS